MSTVQKPASSLDSGEKKRKKMESNRESARKSHEKKKKQMDDLTNEVSALQEEKNDSIKNVILCTERFMNMESANNTLRAQATEYTNRIKSLKMTLQLHYARQGSGFN
ncbi:calvin cycle protein CP12-2 [Hibiscus syriacus]|uniref:Calvin cycle protein CP12-2 n=1 Tax=Hibiscus syriacus TaxID=106335 RepID=A0A6A3C001_HIBSY|nr:bZIP transcription factor 53-like [Hibiscus syriacus]KAE8722144.1 calvin cycle protein CP12-2 [Hibiscus syriacus]